MSNGNHINHDLLVANLRPGQFDANGNPIKDRTGWKHALYCDSQRRNRNVSFEGTPSASTGTVTVADNDFTAEAVLYLGPYTLVSGIHWTPGGSVGASATALAAAIDNLPEYSASPSGADVEIEGPKGPSGIGLSFTAYFKGSIENYTLDPATGELTPGGPTIGGTSSIP